MLHSLIAILPMHFLACLSPGPNASVVIRQSLSGSYRQGFASVMGIATAAIFLSTLTLLGLSAIMMRFPIIQTILALLGGSYLLFIGLSTLRRAFKTRRTISTAIDPHHMSRQSFFKAYSAGLVTNVSNPKSYLYYTTILAPLLPKHLSWEMSMLLVLLISLTSTCAYSVMVLSFGSSLVRQRRAVQSNIVWLSATTFVLVGLYLIYTGISV